MDQSKSNLKSLILLSGLCLGLFGLSYFDLVNMQKIESQDETKAAPVRMLSSIPEEKEANPTSEALNSKMVRLDMGCIDRPKDWTKEIFTMKSKMVQLTGRLCVDKGPGLHDVQIQNVTAKYNATTFIREKSKSFMSDYVPLKVGDNLIHVNFQFQSGNKKSLEFTLNQKPSEVLVSQKKEDEQASPPAY